MKQLILMLVLTVTPTALVAAEMIRWNQVMAMSQCETDLECCTAYNDCGVEGLE